MPRILTEEQIRNDARLREIVRLQKDFKPKHEHCERCSMCLTSGKVHAACFDLMDYYHSTRSFKNFSRVR